MIDDITIVIKTFNRKKALVRLLKSIESSYENLPIIIVDDSKKNYKDEILREFYNLNILYLVEDFDIGLSKGRNILISHVKTKYFLLCDDDFEFDERTNIGKYLQICNAQSIDILGGMVHNRMRIDSLYSLLWTLKDMRRIKYVLHKVELESIYNGAFLISGQDVRLSIDNKTENYNKDNIYETDICSNFFIGDTEKIRKMGGWTPELLKVGEHEIFFFKAKCNKLVVRFCPNFGIVHYPKKTLNYAHFRLRANDLFNVACDMNKRVDSFIVTVNGKSKYVYIRKRKAQHAKNNER